jgi:hypothetical protein
VLFTGAAAQADVLNHCQRKTTQPNTYYSTLNAQRSTLNAQRKRYQKQTFVQKPGDKNRLKTIKQSEYHHPE